MAQLVECKTVVCSRLTAVGVTECSGSVGRALDWGQRVVGSRLTAVGVTERSGSVGNALDWGSKSC